MDLLINVITPSHIHNGKIGTEPNVFFFGEFRLLGKYVPAHLHWATVVWKLIFSLGIDFPNYFKYFMTFILLQLLLFMAIIYSMKNVGEYGYEN